MFKVRHTEETTNRTFRLPKSLVDRMSVLAQQESISLNNFVIQCCEYALEHLDSAEKENK